MSCSIFIYSLVIAYFIHVRPRTQEVVVHHPNVFELELMPLICRRLLSNECRLPAGIQIYILGYPSNIGMRVDSIVIQGLILSAILFAILMGATYLIALAHATNESSYQFGYEYGKIEWNNCIVPEASCGLGHDDCTSTITNAAKVVTNQTACIHGFIDGWNKVCTHSLNNTDGFSKAVCPDYQVNEGLPLGY